MPLLKNSLEICNYPFINFWKISETQYENLKVYTSQKTTLYQEKNDAECPLRYLCHNAKGNRQIEINHQFNQYRKNARKLLKSKEGVYHRKRRAIESESVFGQTKANKHYNRFRHFGLDKVKMDFAIAFNIGKLYNKTQNTPKNQEKLFSFGKNLAIFVLVLTLEHPKYSRTAA